MGPHHNANARKVVGCNAHKFSDWRGFRNFRTKTGVQVRCANGQLVEAYGVGDAGILSNVLLIPQHKTTLISEGKPALSGWKTMTYNRVKDVYDQKWNKVLEAVIQKESNPPNLTVPEGPAKRIAFAGMADQEGQGEHDGLEQYFNYEEQRHWDDLHRRRVNIHARPVHEGRRLAWEDWYTQFNNTLYDHDMDNYNRELWTEMTQMEWDFLAPRETNWRANWDEVSSELRDRLRRLIEYNSDGNIYTEGSVAQAWLTRHKSEQTDLNLDTPPVTPSTSYIAEALARGWGTNEDWGGTAYPTGQWQQ